MKSLQNRELTFDDLNEYFSHFYNVPWWSFSSYLFDDHIIIETNENKKLNEIKHNKSDIFCMYNSVGKW